jgi:hypothetical protein
MDKLDQWELDLLTAGWTATGIYTRDGKYEPGHTAQFRRDGFTVQIYRFCDSLSGHISGWGPDGARIDLPKVYDFPALEAQLAICQECGAEGRTEPVVLRTAKRICPACRTALASELSSQY